MYYSLSPVTNQIAKKSSTHDFEFSQPLIFQWAVRGNCFVESEKVSESDVTKSYFLESACRGWELELRSGMKEESSSQNAPKYVLCWDYIADKGLVCLKGDAIRPHPLHISHLVLHKEMTT